MTRAAQLLAALSLAVAMALVGPGSLPGPAADAASTCDGVWVVVEHPERARTQRCAPGEPADGLDALERAGHAYTFVPRQPGLVCTIDGLPDPCNGAPSDAYWAYYHAEPGATTWTYSTRGAGNRTPAVGSAEAWVYGAGGPPSKPPPAPAPSPEPTTEPPANEGSSGGSGGGGTTSEPSAATGRSGGTTGTGDAGASGGDRAEADAPTDASGRATSDGEDATTAGTGDGSGDGPEDDRRPGPRDRDDAHQDAADDPDAGDDPDAEDDDGPARRATERTDDARASEPLDGTVQLERPGGGGRAAGTAAAGTLVAGLGVAGALRLRRRRLTDGPDQGGIGG